MFDTDRISEQIRADLDRRNAAREETLALSRRVIRTSANAIRAAHRGEPDVAHALLDEAGEAVRSLPARLREFPEIYGAGYTHDCQKEYAEAAVFLAVVAGRPLPGPEEVGVEYPAYLNGLGEAVGEMRRHTLDQMRHGRLDRAETLLDNMDDIYHLLVTLDYPDALTGGLRRTTDAARGIIEKTRGELTVALRQAALQRALEAAMPRGDGEGAAG